MHEERKHKEACKAEPQNQELLEKDRAQKFSVRTPVKLLPSSGGTDSVAVEFCKPEESRPTKLCKRRRFHIET
jgi:hypothetical protein